MSYHQDWFLRQISILVDSIIFFLTGRKPKDEEMVDVKREQLVRNKVYSRLNELVEKHDICGAEDLLFNFLETAGEEYSLSQILYAGVLFYHDLNTMSDNELENNNFSKEEVHSGLESLNKLIYKK